MVQSVERAFAILDAVATRPSGVTALADRLGLPKSHGRPPALLAGGRRRRRARRRPALARRPGRRGVRALARARAEPRAVARPQLEGLVAEIGEDAGLGLPDGYEVHYVEQVESPPPGPGARLDRHARAHAHGPVRARPARRLARRGDRRLCRPRPPRADAADRHRPGAAARPARGRARAPATRGASRNTRRGSTPSPRRSATPPGMRSPRSTSTARRTGFLPPARRSGRPRRSSPRPQRSAGART